MAFLGQFKKFSTKIHILDNYTIAQLHFLSVTVVMWKNGLALGRHMLKYLGMKGRGDATNFQMIQGGNAIIYGKG